jgi:5S rRNA maturation endonuclease (ribonuclease M5)
MPYGICRIAKLKSGGAIAASESHTRRSRATPNADRQKENERFMGTAPGAMALEQEVFDRIGDQKIRKDGVLCVEILLTASPEYFRPGDLGKAGQWDSQQLEDWKGANHQWLNDQFGDRVVRAELHLDESTPHIHAYLVPLDEKEKLNCKSIFGGREKLSQFQDSYGEAMKPLGLERGIKGSRATHTEVKEYYAAVVKEPEMGLTAAEVHHQLADRQLVLKKNRELEQTAQGLAQENQNLSQRLQMVRALMAKQEREAQRWKERYEEQTEQLRQLPLTQVVYELGFEPDLKDSHKWRNEDQILNLTGSKFYDWTQMKGGGGAIDLVMHIQGGNFSEAMAWLQDRFGDRAATAIGMQAVKERVEERERHPFVLPEPDEMKWQAVLEYLRRVRKLPSGIVNELHQQGLVYADGQQNAVFVRRSLDGEVTGAALRGTVGERNSFKGLAEGSRRTEGWFYTVSGGEEGGAIERVVLVEGAIDALSFQILNRPQEKTIILATDGMGALPMGWLRQVERVEVAFDRDAAGTEMAKRIQQEIPQAIRVEPERKDWNEDLQEKMRGIQQQFQMRQMRRDLGQKKDNGLSL